jgi:hypothetical protein
MRKFRLRGGRVTPSLVIATIALFVALSSTGIAATIVPLAKRALTADTAKFANKAKVAERAKTADTAVKADTANSAATAQSASTATTAGDAATLNGMTAAQIAALPGPAAGIPASALTIRSVGWSVQLETQKTDARALCVAGEKAIGGGWDQANGAAYVLQDKPIADGSGWFFRIWADSGDTVPANGSVWVICAKVS